MTSRHRHPRLGVNAIAAAKPAAKEYTLWDGTLGHFGVRVHPSGVRSFIVQTRARGACARSRWGASPRWASRRPDGKRQPCSPACGAARP